MYMYMRVHVHAWTCCGESFSFERGIEEGLFGHIFPLRDHLTHTPLILTAGNLDPSKSTDISLWRIPTPSILQNQPIWVYAGSLLPQSFKIIPYEFMQDPYDLNPSKSSHMSLCRIPMTSILQNHPIWVYAGSLWPQSFKIIPYEFMHDPYSLNPSKSSHMSLCRIPMTSILQNHPIWVYAGSLLPQSFKIIPYELMQDPYDLNPSKSSHMSLCRIPTPSILQNHPIWVKCRIPMTSILQNHPIWVKCRIPTTSILNNQPMSLCRIHTTCTCTCTSILRNQPMWVLVPLAVSFIDFSKVFDSIHRPSLWRGLLSYGIPRMVVKAIEHVYENSRCCVRTEDGSSDWFQVLTGVCLGLHSLPDSLPDSLW